MHDDEYFKKKKLVGRNERNQPYILQNIATRIRVRPIGHSLRRLRKYTCYVAVRLVADCVQTVCRHYQRSRSNNTLHVLLKILLLLGTLDTTLLIVSRRFLSTVHDKTSLPLPLLTAKQNTHSWSISRVINAATMQPNEHFTVYYNKHTGGMTPQRKLS